MNKTHYLIYWDRDTRTYKITTPHDWARENPNTLPNGARTQAIENHLKDKYGFVEFTHSEVVVLCNFDTLIPDF